MAKLIVSITGTVVAAIIVGLLGWIASSVLTTHDQLLTLQQQVAEIASTREGISKLEHRVDLLEYWQRYQGSRRP